MKTTIDVSRYDAYDPAGNPIPVDWRATGYPLAIIKSSEALFTDKAFPMQWQAAGDAGIPRAAYHFFRADKNAVAQAWWCWQILKDEGFTDRDYVILDYETYDGIPPADTLPMAKIWLDEMAKVTRHPPMLYTYPAFWKSVGGEKAGWAKQYPLALAQWPWDNYFLSVKLPPYTWTPAQMSVKLALIDTGAVKPMPLAPWDKPAIWQWTARGDPKQIPGYYANKKAVDLDIVYMDLEAEPAPRKCPTCGQEWKV